MAEDSTKLIIVLEAQSRKLQNSLVQVNRQIDRFAAQTERRFQQMSDKNAKSFDDLGRRMKSSIGGLQNVLGPLTGALGIREIIRYSDAWTEAGNKVAAAAQVSGRSAASLDDLKTSANAARTGLEEYVDLYSRLLRISPSVGASAIDVAKATDVVAKSLKAGGASTQEQTAALIQLGQALGSGQLQGDELRSIRENAPLVAKAIAKEFGVSIGQLKALGAEGKLTSDRVFKALLNSAGDIEAAYDATQSTIGDAFQRINNEFTAYIGTAGQASGATAGLIDALNYLADNFEEIAPLAANFAALLAGAFAGRAIVGGIGQMVVALGALLTAIRTGTLAAGGLTAALGPIGLVAGAVAASLYLLYQYQEDAKRAADEHAKALAENATKLDDAKDSSDQFRNALRAQIQLQTSAASAALAEAKAQLIANAARSQLATSLASVPMLSGIASGASMAFQQMMTADLARIEDAQKTLDALRIQTEDINNTMNLPPGEADKTNTGTGTGSGLENGNEKFKKATDDVIDRTEALLKQTEAQATLNPLVEDYGYTLEKAKVQTDLLQAAHEAGLEITPKLREAIAFLADEYATATAEAAKLTESQNMALESMRGWFDVGRDALSGFITDLKNGKSAAEALGGVFDKLANKFLDMGLDAIFGTGGKDFGIIGSLFGFKDGGIAANGRPQQLPRFANGGVSNSASIFGEAGRPEAAVPLPDGRRIPVDLRMPSSGGSGGALMVSVSVGVQNGELVPLIAQISGEVAGRQIDQKTPAIVHSVAPGAVAKANRNRTR